MSEEKTNLTVASSIEDNVLAALRGIKQDDGYNYTMLQVTSWNGEGFPFVGDYPCAGFVMGEEDNAEIFSNAVRRCKRDFGIEAWVKVGPTRPEVPDCSRAVEKLYADIEKALFADHTRGGNAEDTEFTSRQPLSGGKFLVGVFIRGRIIYRHQVGNAYTKL